MFLRILLAVAIIYFPNALHFSSESLVAGLNLTNLLFVTMVLAIALLAPEGSTRLPGPGRLTAPLLLLFAAYVIAFAIAQVRTPADFIADLTALKTALFYPMIYFVFRNCRMSLRHTVQLIVLLLIVAVAAAFEAIIQAIAQDALSRYDHSARASGPFGVDFRSANLAGFYFALFLPVFVALALFLRGRKVARLAAALAAVALVVAIMATFSRQAYAIALLCLFLVAVRRSLVAAGLICVLMVAGISLVPQSVTQRVEETRQDTGAGIETLDTSSASRLDIWTGALQMWREHPAGVGLNRFEQHIGDYSSYAGFDAHNHYLLMLAQTGLLGFLAMVWVLWRAWRLSRALQNSAPRNDGFALGLAAGFNLTVVAMAIGNVAGSFFESGAAMASFWAFCGLVERYGHLRYAVAAQPEEAAAQTFLGRFPLVARIANQRATRG